MFVAGSRARSWLDAAGAGKVERAWRERSSLEGGEEGSVGRGGGVVSAEPAEGTHRGVVSPHDCLVL